MNSLTKLYYSIGEVAKMFSVNASLLRFWEKEFNLQVKKKNQKGNRLYSQQEIKQLHSIFVLVKEQGYTLEGAKQKLKRKDAIIEQVNPSQVINKLEQIREQLMALKNSRRE